MYVPLRIIMPTIVDCANNSATTMHRAICGEYVQTTTEGGLVRNKRLFPPSTPSRALYYLGPPLAARLEDGFVHVEHLVLVHEGRAGEVAEAGDQGQGRDAGVRRADDHQQRVLPHRREREARERKREEGEQGGKRA